MKRKLIDIPEEGSFVLPLVQKKDRKKRYRHPIFLYSPEQQELISKDEDFDMYIDRLGQIVNIYEHTLEDFEFNSRRIIKHYKTHYGDMSMGMYTLGQSIQFRVYEGQKEPFSLPLFKFFMNYTMLLVPVLLGADLTKWVPWTPEKFTSGAWCDQMDKYIRLCRPLANTRQIGDLLEWTKYLENLFIAKCGDRLGLSISNNDFIEVAKRSKFAYECMSCTFDIAPDIKPNELEKLAKEKTAKFLDIISEQTDLPISIYARNNLFNAGQFKELAVHMGYKPDLYGNTHPFTCNTNIIMGLKNPIAFIVDAYGGRKAEIVKLYVSDAGALERALCMLASGINHVDLDYECDSKHFRTKVLDSVDSLVKLEGRVATLDPDSDEYFIIDPVDTNLVGKKVYIKTPITCTHPRRKEGYICSACYGKLMSNINCDIHPGRLAAINSADDMEQKLLSAKHALATNTNDYEFDTIFDNYFVLDSCQIGFNDEMADMSQDDTEAFRHLYLEFHPASMKKQQDGEGRHFDRAIPEIIIYNDSDDTTLVIKELHGSDIYLSPEFVDFYLDAAKHSDVKDIIRIPFTDLIDNGKILCDVLFEYQYKNNEIADALLELEGILTNGQRINEFRTYDECLNRIGPLFVKGGIHLPDLQSEILISNMIFDSNGNPVDWTLEDPDYQFCSIDKSIQNNQSALTSILYHESSRQLAGAYGTFEKSGTSAYDWFILGKSNK